MPPPLSSWAPPSAPAPAAWRDTGESPPLFSWNDAAPRIIGPWLRSLRTRLAGLEGQIERTQHLLATVRAPSQGARYLLRKAASHFDRALFRARVARTLAFSKGSGSDLLPMTVAARAELADIRDAILGAHRALGNLGLHAAGVRPTPGELGDLDRACREAQTELSLVHARSALLLQVEGQPAGGSAVLAEHDLRRLGKALDPGKPGPQNHWSKAPVQSLCLLGRRLGVITDAQCRRNDELASLALSNEELKGPGSRTVPVGAAYLAAVLKMSGVDLACVDPNQLPAAARYVSAGATRAEQQERLRQALDNFQVLTAHGLPRQPSQEIVELLWMIARIPAEALGSLSEGELAAKFQEVVAAVNAGSGRFQITLGQYSLRLTVAESGQVIASSCDKPGFLTDAWASVNALVPTAVAGLSSLCAGRPGVRTALARLAASLAAIKAGCLIGCATAGAALSGMLSRALEGTARFAEAGASWRRRSARLQAQAADRAVWRSYEAAGRVVSQAEAALAGAQASRNWKRIAEASELLQQGERQRRLSISGAAERAFEAVRSSRSR